MINTFLLLKDGSVLMNQKIEKCPEIPELILFSADSELNTYIIHQYKDYMTEMTDATIIYEAIIMQDSSEGEKFKFKDIPIGKVEASFHDPYEMFQYLHSIHRIDYFNYISKSSDALFRRKIVFGYFKIMISKEGKMIYKKKMTFQTEKGFFTPKDIYKKIWEIYEPIGMMDCNLVIDPVKKKWKFSKERKDRWLFGIPMKHTASVSFITNDTMESFKNLKEFYAYSIIVGSEEKKFVEESTSTYFEVIEEYSNPNEFFGLDMTSYDFWETNILHIIEYVIYLPYLYMLFKMISTFITENDYTSNWSVSTHYGVRIFSNMMKLDRSIDFSDTDEEPLTLQRLVDIITEKDGDDYEEINTFK